MNLQKRLLSKIAYARSGDKGNSSNIGVIAYTEEGYHYLKDYLTAEMVKEFFQAIGVQKVTRYELSNLCAFNFVLENALGGGGSRSLRTDSQGKALGQAILQMPIQVPVDIYPRMKKKETING